MIHSWLEAPWLTNAHFLVAFQHTGSGNHWHNSNRHIIVGRSSASPINSGGHPLRVRQRREVGAQSFKRDRETHSTAASVHKADFLILFWVENKKNLCQSVSLSYFCPYRGQDVFGRTDCNAVQEERSSHVDLLERLLQLRALHRFPGADHLGLAMSNQLDAQPDHLGLLRPAVLPVDRQLDWRHLQKDVSKTRLCWSVWWLSLPVKCLSFLSRRLFRALGALFVSALVISVIFAIIPLCNNVLLLAIAMAVSGLAMGIIDTIANIQLVTIYQKDSAVFLQVGNPAAPTPHV